MIRLLQVRTYSETCLFWEKLNGRNRIEGLNVEQVLSRYSGFEGDWGFFEEGLEIVEEKLLSLSSSVDGDVLVLCPPSEHLPEWICRASCDLGYDFGVCREDYTTYSSIFHEILFGVETELVSWKKELNDHFLFRTLLDAEAYANLHHRLFEEGKDVEGDEAMEILQIWKYGRTVP